MSRLIEKEGKFYKECGVVMLETKNSTNIYLHKNNLYLYPNVTFEQTINTAQHLYITSDDEIKEGDWFYSTENTVEQFKGSVMPIGDDKKIIATTDISLKFWTDNENGKHIWSLSQPSDKFIQVYIDAYNKDEKIEKVLVEYEFGNIESYFDGEVEKLPLELKLKDNSIIIKKVKDSWNRKEVEQLLFNLGADLYHKRIGNGLGSIEKWIEENL